MQTIPNRDGAVGLDRSAGAVVIDFTAVKTVRREAQMDRAAGQAAAALARIEAGRATWTELAAALVAPFNA